MSCSTSLPPGKFLCAVVGTGADGVAEIVGRQTRHHGVKVNDTDAFSGGGIDQDVVDLGVVVGYTQRDLTSRQQIQQGVAVFFPRMDEGDLHETIARFHDTPNRYANFEKALAADALGRAKDIAPEVAFIHARSRLWSGRAVWK